MRRATVLAITLGLLFTVLLTAGRELYPDASRWRGHDDRVLLP
jgi:hypothetical protein